MQIHVSEHALDRFKERFGYAVTKDAIKKMVKRGRWFNNNRYVEYGPVLFCLSPSYTKGGMTVATVKHKD